MAEQTEQTMGGDEEAVLTLGQPAPASTPDTATQAIPVSKPARGGYWWGTGRRKAAVARVRVRPGTGTFQINGRPCDQYFTEDRDRSDIRSPLTATQTLDKLDVLVKVHGGGFTGQAGAVLLGVARALKEYDTALEPILRQHGFLSRDPRKVERKKYGQPGARRRFQFSKR